MIGDGQHTSGRNEHRWIISSEEVVLTDLEPVIV